MADSGIKKVSVIQENLPPVTIIDEKMLYFLRYRITTDDKNRQSHWSPIYRVAVPPIKNRLHMYRIDELASFITIDSNSKSSGVIRVQWNLPPEINNLKEFDVYYRFNYSGNDAFTFGGTVSSNSFAALGVSSNAINFEVAVQIPTYPKVKFDDAVIFSKATQTL